MGSQSLPDQEEGISLTASPYRLISRFHGVEREADSRSASRSGAGERKTFTARIDGRTANRSNSEGVNAIVSEWSVWRNRFFLMYG